MSPLRPALALAGGLFAANEPPSARLRDARDALSADGLDLQAFVTADSSIVARGRVPSGTWFSRALIDATMTLDGASMLGWSGGTIHLGLQGLVGQRGDVVLGDVQTFDNIDARSFGALSEAWVEQTLLGGRLRLKAGRIEANAEFATVDQTAVPMRVRARRTLLHSSPGFSPTIVRMPSYPVQSWGALAEGRPSDNTRVAVGVFDATHFPSILSSHERRSTHAPFSTTMVIGEAEAGWLAGPRDRSGRVSVGGWVLWGPQACDEEICASERSAGVYAVAAQTLWRAPDSERGVRAFAQYGWAPPSASSIVHHGGAGVVLNGVGVTDGIDRLGAGASWVGLRDDLRGETALELFYRAPVQTFVWLQPDVQYLVDPGGDEADAMIVTLRMGVDL